MDKIELLPEGQTIHAPYPDCANVKVNDVKKWVGRECRMRFIADNGKLVDIQCKPGICRFCKKPLPATHFAPISDKPPFNVPMPIYQCGKSAELYDQAARLAEDEKHQRIADSRRGANRRQSEI